MFKGRKELKERITELECQLYDMTKLKESWMTSYQEVKLKLDNALQNSKPLHPYQQAQLEEWRELEKKAYKLRSEKNDYEALVISKAREAAMLELATALGGKYKGNN